MICCDLFSTQYPKRRPKSSRCGSYEAIWEFPRAWKHTVGNSSKARRQRQRERRQTKGLMRQTIAVHVRYKSLYISLPFSARQQREMTKFCVFLRTLVSTANILDFLMELIAGITYLVLAGFWTDLRAERVNLVTYEIRE